MLKKKLQEEAEEVKHARNKSDLTEELADMFEVLQTLSKASGISLDRVEEVRTY